MDARGNTASFVMIRHVFFPLRLRDRLRNFKTLQHYLSLSFYFSRGMHYSYGHLASHWLAVG